MAFRSMMRRKQEPEAPMTTTEGWSPIAALQRDINHMFEQLWSGERLPTMFSEEQMGAAFPTVEITEGEKDIEVSAELPGMSEKDIDISLNAEGNMLMIKGEKKFEKEKKDRDYYRAERSYGSFRRTLPLPCSVEADRTNATFKNGVLEIKMPKAEETKGTKHIEVKS